MAKDRKNIRGNISSDDYSLESILAEYKGTAFIAGDKKTPADVLNEKAEKIILEVTGEDTAEGMLTSEGTAVPADNTQPEHIPEPSKDTRQASEAETDKDLLFFENFKYSSQDTAADIAKEVEQSIAKEMDVEQETRTKVKKAFRLFGGSAGSDTEQYEMPREEPVEEYYPEPDLKAASRVFAQAVNAIAMRYIAAFLISLIIAMMTFTYEAGLIIPFGLGRNHITLSGVLVILQLIVMMLGIDIIVRGFSDILKAKPNAESLVVISCIFTVVSGVCTILFAEKIPDIPLPYCAVSSFSLTFAMLGEQYYLKAITETLKTASASSEPNAMVAEYNKNVKKTILKKMFNRTDSFYNNLMQPDISAIVYAYAAPMLIIAALILSVFTVLAKERGPYFMHILSALFASAASFSPIIAFSGPFLSAARTARRAGAAVAGWGGADDIRYTDGACVTDDDMFPVGTVSLNGSRIFEEISPEKAIRYTASLIIASGSVLSRVFSQLLSTQGMTLIKVEEFACYEGGIGALIRGERVMTGSAAFMNLLGIRIPDDINLSNAVFTAVNDRLIAMFAVNYTPINSVQSALVAMLKWRIKLFFAVRDFNVTPIMLEKKFKVSIDDMEYIPAQDIYSISDNKNKGAGRVAAILIRDGLGSFGEAITGGRLLRTTALISAFLSVLTTVFGFMLMYFMCWIGAFWAARPGNLLIFMASMLAIVIVGCGYIKCRK